MAASGSGNPVNPVNHRTRDGRRARLLLGALAVAGGWAAFDTCLGARRITRAMAAELGPDGIRVNAIGPGLIRTPLNAQNRANTDMEARFMLTTPLGRPGEVEDIAGPAIFLASDLSAYVTGVLIAVDGGFLTR